MLYSGQVCESSTRVLVHESIHDEFVAKMVERAKTIQLGDPSDFDTDMGPVVSERQRDRIVDYMERAKADGATVALGGGTPDGPEFEKGWWIEPTIFTDVTNDMEIAREEIFGPVMVVIKYSTVKEAIAMANDTDYGLTAGVWGTDYEDAVEVGQAAARRDDLDQQLAPDRSGAAVRRLQAVGRGPRARAPVRWTSTPRPSTCTST